MGGGVNRLNPTNPASRLYGRMGRYVPADPANDARVVAMKTRRAELASVGALKRGKNGRKTS